MPKTILQIDAISNILLIALLIFSVIIFLYLFFIPAPYGRYVRSNNPSHIRRRSLLLSKRTSWLIMEVPAVITVLFLWCISDVGINGLIRGNTNIIVSLLFGVFVLIWEFHYIYRTFISTFLFKEEQNNFTLYIVILGLIFNLLNGFLNGWFLFFRKIILNPEITSNPTIILSSMKTTHFLIGLIVFFIGFFIHIKSDKILRIVKREHQGNYGIPNSFLHKYIASPNYLGEIIQWWGWAILTWSPAAVSFALFTMANLVPRAFSNLQWYRKTFADFPPSRKAIIPFII